jgi:hypothetical protein
MRASGQSDFKKKTMNVLGKEKAQVNAPKPSKRGELAAAFGKFEAKGRTRGG